MIFPVYLDFSTKLIQFLLDQLLLFPQIFIIEFFIPEILPQGGYFLLEHFVLGLELIRNWNFETLIVLIQ